MKTNNIFYYTSGWSMVTAINTIAFLVMLALPVDVFPCDYCNKNIYDDLKNGARGQTLAGKELLEAINSQGGFNSPLLAYAGSTESNTQQTIKNTDEKKEFIEIINRDNKLQIPATGYVPQNSKPDKKVTITLEEGEAYLGNGVMFKGFTTNGTIPGPTIIVEEDDIVEFTVENKGNIPHGASIHAAYTQTSKYLGKINPLQSKKFLFKCTFPGVYMYHCAPGGHAIPMHVLFGQYGMMVVKPKKKFKLEQILNKKPDVEIYLTQHEWYASGKDAIEAKPMYVTFNGKLFRYVEEPIKAKPGDYVRINFLNVGPNLISTFHIVGIIWDYVYWQGNPDVVFPGGQSVLAGPTDSWVVEFRMPPDEGAYLMLTHAVGSTDRGAIGLLMCDKNAQTPVAIMSDGPKYTEEKMKEFKSKSVRTISPFEPGSPDVDAPVKFSGDTAVVHIIGNSYYPKVLNITKGMTVKWINEDVFTYMDGEFAGIHNVISTDAPERFNSPMLTHAQKFSFTFNKVGDYKYMCTPHPYMKGMITVSSGINVSDDSGSFSSATWALILSIVAIAIGLWLIFTKCTNHEK